MKFKQYDFRTAYIDLLLNVLTTILFILAIAFAMVTVKKNAEEAGVKPNAQYLVTSTWDPNSNCDVDLWVQDSLGNVVFYRQLSKGIMHIERDDLGKRGDMLINSDGEQIAVAKENKETWALRGKQYGEFTFNVHLYSCSVGEGNKAVAMPLGTPVNLDVYIEFIKVNPDIISLRKQKITFTEVWQEKTAFIATFTEYGAVTFDDTIQRQLVNVNKEMSQ